MKIVILAEESDSTAIVYNKLSEEFKDINIIIEKPVSRRKLILRRIRHLGFIRVAGQIVFLLFIKPFLVHESKKRIREIIDENHMNTEKTYLNTDNSYFVDSVNSSECRKQLLLLQPEIVVVNGTRIIEKKTIECVNALMINMHAGITPKYRGVHGAYWALTENDVENCGVTVHKIDTGIDTGDIIYQERIKITQADNFITYPFLQTAVGIRLEIEAIRDYENKQLCYKSSNLPSKLWTHPTWLEYLKFRWKGIK